MERYTRYLYTVYIYAYPHTQARNYVRMVVCVVIIQVETEVCMYVGRMVCVSNSMAVESSVG